MRKELELRKPFLDLWPGHVSRIEPAAGSTFGFPDTHLSYDGMSALVEFKHLEQDKTFSLRASQKVWHTRHNMAGLHDCFFVVLSEQFVYVIPSPLVIASLSGLDCPLLAGEGEALGRLGALTQQYLWDELSPLVVSDALRSGQ